MKTYAEPDMKWLVRHLKKRHWADWWGPAVFVILAGNRWLEVVPQSDQRVLAQGEQPLPGVSFHWDDYFNGGAFLLLLLLFVLCASPFVQRVFARSLPLLPHERFALATLSALAVALWLTAYGGEFFSAHPYVWYVHDIGVAAGLSLVGWFLWIKWTKSPDRCEPGA